MFLYMYFAVFITAYETTSPQKTTTNETEMYARLQQPVIPEVRDENSSAAVTAAHAAAGCDNEGYEIPITSYTAPSHPYANVGYVT